MKRIQQLSFFLVMLLCLTCHFTACGKSDNTEFVCRYSDQLGGYVIVGCHNPGKTLTFPSEYEGKPVVGIESPCFYGNVYRNTTEINIPVSITSINVAISGCTALTKITVAEGNPNYHSNGNCLIETVTNTLIWGCKTSLVPDYVAAIEEFAFINSDLTEITLSDRISSIGAGAFSGCKQLTKITVAEENPYYHIDGNTLIETSTNTLVWGGDNSTIPDYVTVIASHAFNGAKITKLTIPSSVTVIGEMAISHCPDLTMLTVAEENNTYHSSGNCLIETETNTLLFGCKSSVIPDGVETIAAYAFASCETLTSLVIPVSVVTIESFAFDGCYQLTELYYQGTKAQWAEVDQQLLNNMDDIGMIYDSPFISTIHCTDGDITKQ